MKKRSIAWLPLLAGAVCLFISACSMTPPVDDSKCDPSVCPTSYDAPDDSFPYKGLKELEALTFEQRLDYLGSVHKALLAPEAYRTHRAPLLWKGEGPVLGTIMRKDGAFRSMAAMTLTINRTHPGEPLFDATVKEAQRDPALVAAIQSRVPVIPGYDALMPNRTDRYTMVEAFRDIYGGVVRAAQKGDPQSCEVVAPFDTWVLAAYDDKLNVFDLNDACAKLAIPSQAKYQHRVGLRAVQISANHDEPRIEQRHQEWVNKAMAVEMKCRRVGVDPGQITYDKRVTMSVSRDMQANFDGSYKDGMDEPQYRDFIAEKVYEYREAEKYNNGAVITPILTPYLYIAAVGRSCG